MSSKPLKRLLARFLLGLEGDLATFRKGLRRALFSRRPFEVVPYLGFGTPERLFIRGRVIEDKGLTLATPDASRWRNFSDTYKRFVSNKVSYARLLVRYPGGERELRADAKGYFSAVLEPAAPVPEGWCEVHYELLEPLPKGAEAPPATATGFVLVPARDAQFGVISDMDDTVVQTDVTRWLRVLGTVLFGNAYTRLPFAGVAAFYQALRDSRTTNPLFYVSSSPWNLYDLLLEFLNLGQIPLGPLSLRDWRGGAGELFPSEHGAFKQGEIRRILDFFPELPFILIGDSGEEDPEIYGDIVSSYPGRILAVYIRNVSGEARSAAVARLARKVQEMGSKLVLADDTLAAAKHAAAEGWIRENALGGVRARKERDTHFGAEFFGGERETVATVIEKKVRGARD